MIKIWSTDQRNWTFKKKTLFDDFGGHIRLNKLIVYPKYWSLQINVMLNIYCLERFFEESPGLLIFFFSISSVMLKAFYTPYSSISLFFIKMGEFELYIQPPPLPAPPPLTVNQRMPLTPDCISFISTKQQFPGVSAYYTTGMVLGYTWRKWNGSTTITVQAAIHSTLLSMLTNTRVFWYVIQVK